jgi:hypothetical protein
MHIIFEEHVTGALQEVWSIIHYHTILILKLEEWLLSGSTQQFQGLDTVGTHVTDSNNNFSPEILQVLITSFKNLTKRLALVLPHLKH